MVFSKKIFFTLILGCLTSLTFAQYIQVNDTFTAQQLVEDKLVNSPCANVSNISVSGDTFSPGEQSYGYFKNNNGNFPFSEGIILATSRANRASGPNNNLIDEGSTAWLGDSDLEEALNITSTFNATVLEFDFIPLTSKISFDYIFSSEEYQGNSPCRYSDGFAFLLKEAGTTNKYQNLALIPNTNTPVLVTSVHPEIPGRCPAINENYFGGYNNTASATNYNGQTVVLKALANVTPGIKYHIKLVIADHENVRYDSAIFLGLKSFNTGIDLGEDRLISDRNPICEGETISLDATIAGNNSYKWFKNGTELVGENNGIYLVTAPGIYKAEVSIGSSNCKSTDEITIEYTSLPVLNNTILVQCDYNKTGKTKFNLTKADAIIKNGGQNLGNVIYYENSIDAQNQNLSKAITNPTNYESVAKTIYASVQNSFECRNVASINLQISNNQVSSFHDLESCDLDGLIDGFYGLELSQADSKVLSGLPAGLVVEYYETLNDALLQRNVLPAIFRNTIRYEMTIYAKIINGSDCYGIIPLRLFVNSNTPKNFQDVTAILCEGKSITLEVSNTFNNYSWSNGDKSNSTKITNSGTYTVTVSDINTCLATKKFTVISSNKAIITGVEINDFNNEDNTILIKFIGLGNYEFSIDGINFQDTPYFTKVLEGEYTLIVKDQNGCGITTKKIYVLNYPRYFTPNGDGVNDLWSIPNLSVYPNSIISIFDRYNKLIYQFKGNKKAWDGKYNSQELPASDYWFTITLENGKIIKGHFSLIR